MNPTELKEFKDQFERAQSILPRTDLHRRFYPFDRDGPTWEKRVELRKFLLVDLERAGVSFSKEWREKLAKPGGHPKIPMGSASISHCRILGGVIFSLDKSISLGLDIEIAGRVQRTVERLSSGREIEEAPTPDLLWSAKEAAFKSIQSAKGRPLLSHLRIFDWRQAGREKEHYHFSFCWTQGDGEGKGMAFLFAGLVAACAQRFVFGGL